MESGFLFYYIYFLCNNIQHFYAFWVRTQQKTHFFSMVAHSELALSANPDSEKINCLLSQLSQSMK